MLVWNILKTVAVDWSAGNFVQVVLKVWEMHQWMPKNFSHNLMFMVHDWCSFQTEELDEWWCMSRAWDFSVMLEILQWPFDIRSHHAGQTRLLIRQATPDCFMFLSKWLESWICCFRKGMLRMLEFWISTCRQRWNQDETEWNNERRWGISWIYNMNLWILVCLFQVSEGLLSPRQRGTSGWKYMH